MLPEFICITDTHLNINNISTNIDIYKQVIKEAKLLDIRTVYHLGDIFDSRKAQPLPVLKTFKEILSLFEEANIELIAIPGNHDKLDYTSEESYLDVFEDSSVFKVIKDYDINGNICAIPFFDEKTTYQKYLDKLFKDAEENDIDLSETILLTHIAISGVKNNDGSEVSNNIKQKQFKVFNKVLVGHYHNESKVGDNIYYIGSAFQHNFGEDDNKGYVIIYDNNEIKKKQLNFPKYIKKKFDVEKYTPKQIEKEIENFDLKNNHVRFIIEGEYEKINSIDTEKIKSKGVDIKLKSTEIDIVVNKAENNQFQPFSKSNVINEFQEFCKINNLDYEYGVKFLKFLNK